MRCVLVVLREEGKGERTISDFGATDQFSLQRFESPLTTSALLPINLSSPITFFRQVPILSNQSNQSRFVD